MELNVLPFGMHDQTLARRIAKAAQDSSKVILLPHARQRMRQRKILFTQVIQVLTRGRVIEHAHRDIFGNWKCTLELLIAGDRIKVVTVLEEKHHDTVIVITVIN